MNKNSNNQHCQYLFGNYLLRSDGILTFENNEIHIPPKEFEVLMMLLKSAGKILSKEEIFDNVWCNNAASDESLTRCIYALRRILREDRNNRYIETVYGKGYRFRVQVAVVSKNEQTDVNTSIAILPFKTPHVIDETLLHHGLIHGLSRYSCLGITVLPASVTQGCIDFNTSSLLINQLLPDYYLTGKIIEQGQENRLFIELIRSEGHRLIDHRSISYSHENKVSVILSNIVNLLVEKIPSINITKNELTNTESFETAVICLNGKMDLKKFTPESITKALETFKICVQQNPTSIQSYCYIAECYISLAQLGVFSHKMAMENAIKHIEKAIELDPSYAQALGLLGLLTGLRGEGSVADVLFKQAHVLIPNSPDINYYHGLYYFIKGNTEQAKKMLDSCLDIDSGRVSAAILKVWLTYYTKSHEQAYILGKSIYQHLGYSHPIILSMLALFSALAGYNQKSLSYLSEITQINIDGFLYANNLYTNHLIYGKQSEATIKNYLKSVDFSKVKGSILPLILVTNGKEAMLRHLEELEKESNGWSKIWLQDPRIKNNIINKERCANGKAA